MKNVCICLFVALLLSGCFKDKLTGDLEQFKGRYTWSYSKYKADWWSTSWSITDASLQAYSAEVEFTDNGKIIFYIDGEQLHKTGYSIKSDDISTFENTVSMDVNPTKEDSKDVDFNNTISFSIAEDTLSVGGFPGPSYDEQLSGTGYFIRN